MEEGDTSMQSEQQEQQSAKSGSLFKFLIFGVILLVILGAFTLVQRRSQYQALAEETQARAIPTVAVIHPFAEAPQEDLVLPGTMQAYVESPIYARTNGYLKKWYHDFGSRAPTSIRRRLTPTCQKSPRLDTRILSKRTACPSRKWTTPWATWKRKTRR